MLEALSVHHLPRRLEKEKCQCASATFMRRLSGTPFAKLVSAPPVHVRPRRHVGRGIPYQGITQPRPLPERYLGRRLLAPALVAVVLRIVVVIRQAVVVARILVPREAATSNLARIKVL